MPSLDFSSTDIQLLITHQVGNKTMGDPIQLSDQLTQMTDHTKDLLKTYFLTPIKSEEFFAFSDEENLRSNEMFTLINRLFEDPDYFITGSHELARRLYEFSSHPKIKVGKLNIAYLNNVIIDDELVDAVGLFKSDAEIPFLQMHQNGTKFRIEDMLGYDVKTLDKGCIIYNTDRDKGYKISIIDTVNKSSEAQFWKDDFLVVSAIANDYYHTKQYMGVTKEFVSDQLDEEFEVSKTDKLEFLNRSAKYFKSHEKFDKREFEQEVFQEPAVIHAFNSFNQQYNSERENPLSDNFTISAQAFRKQAKDFKSVLKLDKNFHVYIHGNRELIQQGKESDGRKFYKIYFEKEE